jgi:hypothetical protein
VRFACSVASIARGEPVEATASQVRRWLLVEVTGPWGRDAITQSEMGPYAPEVWRRAMKLRGIRVIAIRRDLHHRSDGEGVRLVYVEAPRPGESSATAQRIVVPALHDIVGATASLAGGHGVSVAWKPDGDRYVLVCTNGRHDACCATYGRPLVRDLRDSHWAAQVWECSHIGGDRWAANLVLLPDSLYFGHQDSDSARRVLAAHDTGRLELTGFRGRTTSRLIEQAAEHHVRATLRLERLDAVRAIERPDDHTVRITVLTSDGLAVCTLLLEREDVPASTPLTCKGRPGQHYPAFHVLQMAVEPTTETASHEEDGQHAGPRHRSLER